MNKWTKNITEKQLYLIIIISVGALIILNQYIAHHLLNLVESEEYATNITGKLAIESQELETLGFRAVVDTSYFDDLQEEAEAWYAMEKKMEETDSRLYLNQADTEQVQNYLDELHKQGDELYALIVNLENPAELAENIDQLAVLQDRYSARAYELYDLLETISENGLTNLRTVEIVIALISLILLWLEFQFIIRPIIEELRRRKEKLEALNKSKDRILATVAHDVRNPLNGIQGMLQILKEQAENLTEEDLELINLSEVSCKKAEGLIQELLDISKLESEEFHLETEIVHLEQYLKGIVTQFRRKAENKNIELRLKITPESLKAKVDKSQFSRVIENIVGNAIKFTEKGEVELYSKIKEGNVVIEIRDTGIGIPDKLKEYIFDKFTKARRLGTKGEMTTGLGMSIVKTIVEKHGGKIWFDSEEGEGTVFFITLPKE